MLSTIVLTAKSRYSKQRTDITYKQWDQYSEEISDVDWSSDTNALSDDTEFDFPIRNAPQKDGKKEAQGNLLQVESIIYENGEVNVLLNTVYEKYKTV